MFESFRLANFEHPTWQQQKLEYDRLHFQSSEQGREVVCCSSRFASILEEIEL